VWMDQQKMPKAAETAEWVLERVDLPGADRAEAAQIYVDSVGAKAVNKFLALMKKRDVTPDEDPEGAIVEVLERRTHQVAGRFTLEGGVGFVTPDNRRISQRVVVPREAAGTARHGDLAVVEIAEQPSRNRDPVGRVLRVLPEGGGADTAIDLAIASFGLSHAFPPEALAEARKFGPEVSATAHAGREDLRALPLVTIDGEDARDFDDAVFAEPSGAGFRLVVAIADVSHYVRPGTTLDREARERATSVYFPSRVLPDSPVWAATALCSSISQPCAIITRLSILTPRRSTVEPTMARSIVELAPISTASSITTSPACCSRRRAAVSSSPGSRKPYLRDRSKPMSSGSAR